MLTTQHDHIAGDPRSLSCFLSGQPQFAFQFDFRRHANGFRPILMHRFDESFIVGFIHGKAKVIPKIIYIQGITKGSPQSTVIEVLFPGLGSLPWFICALACSKEYHKPCPPFFIPIQTANYFSRLELLENLAMIPDPQRLF